MSTDAHKKTENFREKTLPHLTGEFFNFRQIWLLAFVSTAAFAIVPVIFFAVMDYNLTHRSMEQDAVARTSRLASNTWRSVSFFLDQRKNALSYMVNSNSLATLTDSQQLDKILSGLTKSFGGFTDIGIIDATGHQRAYAGPYELVGKDYSSQDWFKKVMDQGVFVSDVFLGYRNVPHISISIRHEFKDLGTFVMRATIEHQLNRMLGQIEKTDRSDAFLINAQGTLQTRSNFYGDVLDAIPMALPPRTDETRTFSLKVDGEDNCIAAYRYIPDTPFVLMVIKSKQALMSPWRASRETLLQYLVVSITVILLWVWGVTSYMIGRLKQVDRKRAKYFHLAEYANKMASIGRLAAGVAHEINNPLAIINEKAGLIKDMFHFKKEYQDDPRLIEIIDIILGSVERCSRITRQLLSFGRNTETRLQSLNVKTILDEVLVFLGKEAAFRKIDLNIDIPADLPAITCDRGKLQQILLNIINNAFSAMSQGGKLSVKARQDTPEFISMVITDTGCGIPEENLKEIFEPFFSTKVKEGGTGLGLSITYGLLQELGGQVKVESHLDHGTEFKILLPLKPKKEE